MNRKKSPFFTFCFSLLPGAGQMYLGFMKRGVSLMSSFFLIIFISAWLNLEPFLLTLPIIWFFSFFDTHNLRSMPDEKFLALKDDFILIPDLLKESAHAVKGKYRNVIAIALIVLGFTLIWNNMYYIIRTYLPNIVADVIYRIGRITPQLVIGVAIIALGILLIRGKKEELDEIPYNQLEDKGGEQ